MDTNKIESAYNDIIRLTEAAFDAAKKYEAAKEIFETNCAEGVKNGNITGKNEFERNMAAISAFHEAYKAMKDFNAEYDECRHNLNLAKIHLECLRDLLRIEELVKPVILSDYKHEIIR